MSEARSAADSGPCTFGQADRLLFGWYHPPKTTPRDTAVLLCSPVGWEALATQRTYRELAERLSQVGFATLRFDLDGTGDSAGSDDDPQRVHAWLESIASAAAELRRLSGLQQLSFFGAHLGATLAAQVAATREPVATLVLWAPFVQGKQFARQIRAYGALNRAEPSSVGDQDAAGFLYRSDTLHALSKIDLLQLPPPAPRVLLLQSESRSSAVEQLADAWRERGATVACEAHGGYSELTQESDKSRVPDQLVERIVEWLSVQHPLQPGQTTIDPTPRSLSVDRASFGAEEPCFFGPGDQFFGILTRAARSACERPTVVFLNTSSDYRVGPHRMYVALSRQLAASGFGSFRFDPIGIGDHCARRIDDPADAYSESRLSQTRVVLDFLESHGAGRQFILVGLCSGAYVAYHAGLGDERVAGTVLINLQTFAWKAGDSLEATIRGSFKSTRSYRRASRELITWRRVLAGEVNLVGIGLTLARRLSAPVLQGAARAVRWPGSSRWRVEQGFKTLLERGSRVLVIFDEYAGGRDVFDAQVGKDGRSLRGDPRFQLEIVRGADHTFSRVHDQRRLFALLRDYFDHWPPQAS